MPYYITTATKKIRNLNKRIRAVQGGTSASKTIGILQNLIDFAQSDKVPTLTSVVSESMPHIKKGAELDFLNIMRQSGYYKEDLWHRTDHKYTFETGSIMEFFSADDASKVRGPRRDRLFLNECNNISFETFEQLELRTNEFIFLDWNPVEDFWYYEEIEGKRDDTEFIVLNYMDNEAINPQVKASLESRKNRVNWWRVYGLGLRGEIEGRIYTGWQVIDDIPFEARLERYGIDFGYSNDPTAIVAVYYYNGGYILDEVSYQLGQSNKLIADVINAQTKKALVIADSAEPKSIDEIRGNGITILPSKKGPGSINQGIQYVQAQQISVTKRSVNLLSEYRKYMWMTDKDGKIINEPNDFENHAMDAVRYALSSIKNPNQTGAYVHYAPSALPRNNMSAFQTQQGLPPELKEKPKTAYVHVPRL